MVELASLTGWLVYHTHDSRRSQAGFPDLTMVRERVVFAELKSQKGRLTKEQSEWQERLQKAGAEIYVWRPADHEVVAAVLKPESGNIHTW